MKDIYENKIYGDLQLKGGYYGHDTLPGGYLRTPTAGLLPNVSGGSGNIGTSSWRFAFGYFQNVDVSANIKASTMYTPNFYRSTGNSGWYNETYGGGIYMTDKEYVRVYGNKHFICNKNIYASNFVSSDVGNATALWSYALSYGHIQAIQFGNTERTYIHCFTNIGAFGINIWASDKSLKEHIKDTEVNYALEKINKLQHVSFDWKESNGHCELGYVADDIEKVLPCLIHEVEQQKNEETGVTPKPLKHINHTTLLPLITMGVQELIQENKYLWEFNNAVVEEVCLLKGRIDKLETLVTKLLEENGG